jgi:hypothetical protein
MTSQEFKDAITEIAQNNDIEGGHTKMDELMCAVLKELGYGEGVKVFEDAEKWYS